jgi:hypothetical protein
MKSGLGNADREGGENQDRQLRAEAANQHQPREREESQKQEKQNK